MTQKRIQTITETNRVRSINKTKIKGETSVRTYQIHMVSCAKRFATKTETEETA